jgi:hypothetical protein
MKRLFVFVLVLLGLLAVVGMAAASVTGFTLECRLLARRVSITESRFETCRVSSGQVDPEVMSGGGYDLQGGF